LGSTGYKLVKKQDIKWSDGSYHQQ